MGVALDSTAVIGFLDRDDALHTAADAKLRDLVGRQRLIASVITYAELLTGARLGHHPESHVAGFFAEVITQVVPVDLEIADRAAALRARASTLRLPDALIIATAEADPEVELLVTGDEAVAKLRGVGPRVHLLRP